MPVELRVIRPDELCDAEHEQQVRDHRAGQRAKARVAYPAVLRAVLFDWGDTLMRWAPEPDLLEAGHAAGFGAIDRDPVPALTTRFRDAYLSAFFEPGLIEEIEYPAEVRRL